MKSTSRNQTIACAFGVTLFVIVGTVLSDPARLGVPIWPASGLIAAWVWTRGPASIPPIVASVFIGLSVVSGVDSAALTASLAAAIAAGLEAAVAYVVMTRKSSGRSPLVHGRLLVLTALTAPLISGVVTTAGAEGWGSNEGLFAFEVGFQWVRHSLGILLLGPMFVFALVSKPDGRRRGGRLIASLVLLSLLVTLNFVLARQRLDQELETATEAATLAAAATVELGLSHVAELVFSLASYFEASDEVTPDEFQHFVTPPLQRIGEVKSLMWIELDSTASEERAWLSYAHPEPPERLHEGDLLRDPEVGPLLMARDRSRVEVGQLSSERGRGSFVAVVWSNRGRSSGWAAAELSLHEFLLHVFQGEIPDGLELRTSKTGDHAPNPRAARIYFGNYPVDVMLQGTPLGAQNRHRNALLLAYVVGTLFAAAVVLFLLVVTAHNAELGAEIASRHEAERRLASLADQLERSNRDLEAFASGASHDLRAPLRAITGLTGVVLQDEGARLTEEARHMLSLVRKRADRLENMIRGLLAYARARANDDPEPVDLRALVSEAIDVAVVPSAFVLHVQVPPSARVRRVALLAVLSNLIANAVRHHDRSSGNIGVSARRVGDRLKWIVEDDGPGVPESDREKIFGVFTTLRARDEAESTGMGLATVRRLVSGEGGEIYCESGDFRGVRMRFSWPTPPEDQENG